MMKSNKHLISRAVLQSTNITLVNEFQINNISERNLQINLLKKTFFKNLLKKFLELRNANKLKWTTWLYEGRIFFSGIF